MTNFSELELKCYIKEFIQQVCQQIADQSLILVFYGFKLSTNTVLGVNKHTFYVKRKSCHSRHHFISRISSWTIHYCFKKTFSKKVLIVYTLDIFYIDSYGKFFSKKKKTVNSYFDVSIKVPFTFYAINYNYTTFSNVRQLFQKINDKSPITFYWEEYIQYETTYILLLQ